MEIESGISSLRTNFERERKIIVELAIFFRHLSTLENLQRLNYKINIREKFIFESTISSLLLQLKILNDSIPALISGVSYIKNIPPFKGRLEEELISVSYKTPSAKKPEVIVTIKRSDKSRFLKELSMSEGSVTRLKKDYSPIREKVETFKKSGFYSQLSNKLFLNLSSKLIEKGRFVYLGDELKKSNMPFLFSTYLSISFLTSALSVFLAVFLVIFLLFFNLGISYPFISALESGMGMRFLQTFWLIFAIPVMVFLGFYFYPYTERKSISSKINQEIPFAVIHMAAIAGSGVEPTKIFSVIAASDEYPCTRKEIRKLLNRINLYGYDLVSALGESAKLAASSKLAELLNGLATAITSGGNLAEFLNKRAETLIFDYKIERERYTKMAETFMDIYISVVIAAPMILTLLLVMMSITGMSFGLSPDMIGVLMIAGVSLLNLLFLMFLHFKQPSG